MRGGDECGWVSLRLKAMTSSLSFTRQDAQRYPAPDVARGFMLLLIALANVTFWAEVVGPRVSYSQVDSVLTVLRVVLVDQRAYPLFAVLFGYGLMMMVKRRRQSFVAQAVQVQEIHGGGSVFAGQAGESGGVDSGVVNPAMAFRREATTAARRLLRRRGWWMLLFGAVHGMLFPGDIIGTYAVIALVLAGIVASENTSGLLIIGGILGALSVFGMVIVGVGAVLDPSIADLAHPGLPMDPVWYAPARNVALWVAVTLSGALSSMAVLGVAVGAFLATTTFISHPHQHRRVLELVAAGGLLVAFVGGLPYALVLSELINVNLQWWMLPVNQLAGLAGAAGWLALWTVFAGPAPTMGRLRGARWVLSAVGRRSMTSYVVQSVLFAVIFLPMYGRGLQVSEGAGLLIAAGVWLVTVALAVWFEVSGRQGPLERLLRVAVLRGERRANVELSGVLPVSASGVSVSESAGLAFFGGGSESDPQR